MADFSETRDSLRAARGEKERARQALSDARERLRQLDTEQAELDRVFNRDDQGHLARRRRLERARDEAAAEAEKHSDSLAALRDAESGLFNDFAVFTDPRQQAEQFSADFPFLLLPVRIETRFKTVTEGASTQRQLWARVYPDDCAVDSFEATLSRDEVRSARAYWAESWSAGVVEGAERAAWRGLVASHGPGRAAWIVQNYRPLNAADKPPKGDRPDDVFLVIVTEQPLGDDERQRLETFWADVWLADGDRVKVEAAFGALSSPPLDAARAARLAEQYKPFNLDAKPRKPLKKSEVAVRVFTAVLPPPEATPTKEQAWSQSPKVRVLPDRFVLVGYSGNNVVFEAVGNPIPSPLVVGPDPNADPADQLAQSGGDLVIPEEMRWMTDFARAVDVGMGFRINLTAAQARAGFDRIVALGLRFSADEGDARELVEDLFRHHRDGRSGLSLLPQGTATNNTEEAGSGFTRTADADASYDDNFGPPAGDLSVGPDEWSKKRDGQWLAEYLGIDPDALSHVRHADGTDQSEARAMNVALWPATLGYMMETMMQPVFDDATVEKTRWFFNNFVSGRGAIPAVRIGSQPYGILPTTAFSRLGWLDSTRLAPPPGLDHPEGYRAFLKSLGALLGKMDEDWARMAERVSAVGKQPPPGSDAHKMLLDIVGLHPASVEFHQRYAESLEHLFNFFNLYGFGRNFLTGLDGAGLYRAGKELLAKLGYAGDAPADMMKRFFLSTQNLLKGPVIDDRPPSETERIRKYTDEADEAKRRNYIQWLIDAAKSSLETIRSQQGFKDNKPPTALLHLMLRHALVLGYWDTSLRLHNEADLHPPPSARREPSFVHVEAAGGESESRWARLYKPEPRITNSQSQLVADFIPQLLFRAPAARYLSEQVGALELLKDAPTARLERAFAEHIDCCSYRLDAWRLGLVHYQLAAMRYGRGQDGVVARKGLYLGAYGWLEDVRPENKVLTPVNDLDPEQRAEFQRENDAPLLRDNTNGGYIHAPSLNHAVTAAVLRNGYLANASPGNPGTLSVNLSSERVRRALIVLEGIRGGQSLGALLGYQFERGLHDRHAQAEVDRFIFGLRKAFPLRANRLSNTKVEDEDVSIEAIEARNVMDGLLFVEHVKKTGSRTYPFGKNLPAADPAQAAAINAEADRLLDTHEAVADLALAEGVHQAVQGNYDRASSTLDAYSRGNFPPEPDVVRTPRSGVALTHRVGVQFEAGLAPSGTPRAQAEPALNKWLGGVLPALSDVFCRVEYFDPAAQAQAGHEVTLQDLQLEPIDVLYLLRTEGQQAMAELDDRVLRRVIDAVGPRPDAELKIKYMLRADGKVSVFELTPLVESLRSLLLRSRPLRASDVALQTGSRQEHDEAVFVDKQRVVAARAAVAALHSGLNSFGAAPSNIDAAITQLATLLAGASGVGVPQTGWGWLYEWKRLAFGGVLGAVGELVARWDERLGEYDALVARYENPPAGATAAQLFELLQRAEGLISTQPTAPLPATPPDFKPVLDAKLNQFVTRRDRFENEVLRANTTSLNTLVNSAKALLPVVAFDPVGLDLTKIEERIAHFAEELNARAVAVAVETGKRLNDSEALLDAHDAAAAAPERARLLESAAVTLLGDDFRLVPEFGVGAAQGDEWEKSLNAGADPNGLLRHQRQTLKSDFPLDDWLYGLARVREKLSHWERVLMLARAFGRTEPELAPAQLPFQPDDHWLGLEFPAGAKLAGDRLLYTAHYAAPFDKAARQCGLLLDEWTEVIPGGEETTGLTFHFDRPNSEPPQTMLLVTPPGPGGAWAWGDILDAVNETLEMAKKRAVEPAQVDTTPYARFLPATVMAATLYQISIANDLSANNNFLSAPE
ncbi:MAG TPA: hypothetical protein VF591_21595 [Pyrinomonadaceae bacterium]|jgi:hypothetical protein